MSERVNECLDSESETLSPVLKKEYGQDKNGGNKRKM